jgi:3-phosphoshikimate 1-carboxyvinyltransferase
MQGDLAACRMPAVIRRSTGLNGTVSVPGDKAISHRIVLFGAIAEGRMVASNWLSSRATDITVSCAQALGVRVERDGPAHITVDASGVASTPFTPPGKDLYCHRSATTMRLLIGLLAGCDFATTITGDPVLNARPMERVAQPLRLMGAEITTNQGGGPVRIRGARLRPIEYHSPVASAHVHTAIILAARYTRGTTVIHQPGIARDHSIRLLRAMGARIETDNSDIYAENSGTPLRGITTVVPGDMSAAAYWIVAATVVPDSELRINGVGLNPTRTGLITALRRMGADITIDNVVEHGGEPVGDVTVRSAALSGITVAKEATLYMIDDLPVFAVAAIAARGKTVVRDAGELRVKDSDRISALVRQLGLLGARIVEHADGFEVDGPQRLQGATVCSERDHRIGLTLGIAALLAQGMTTLVDQEELTESYPGFLPALAAVGGQVSVLSNREGPRK